VSDRGRRAKVAADMERWAAMSDAEKHAWVLEHYKLDPNNMRMRPDAHIAWCRMQWAERGNPYHVWKAIDICSENGTDFPSWVKDYLASCAKRMMSPEAARVQDTRMVLPVIFGFNTERGKHLLNPDGNDDNYDYMLLGMKFFIQIALGDEPTAAIEHVRISVDEAVVPKDDRTLLKGIKRHYDIMAAPRTRTEWMKVMRPLQTQIEQAIRFFVEQATRE
jgi:hypothetical protein